MSRAICIALCLSAISCAGSFEQAEQPRSAHSGVHVAIEITTLPASKEELDFAIAFS